MVQRSSGVVIAVVTALAATVAIAITAVSIVKNKKKKVKEKLKVEMRDIRYYGGERRPRANAIWDDELPYINPRIHRPSKIPSSKFYQSDDEEEEPPRKKSNLTEIVSVPADGDCLFHSIALALEQEIKEKVSVDDLRQIVADNIDEDTFNTLYSIYKSALKEKDTAILADYLFMRNVQNIDDLREVIAKDRVYWGDEMAVTILQEQLGITFLIFTRDSGKIKLSQQYGEIVKPFTGKYLMLLLQTLHYRPIKYEDRFMHTFEQLPPEVRKNITKNKKGK